MCCKRSYLPEDLESYLPTIWSGLRNEVFMGGNDVVTNECMTLISAAFAMLSNSPTILNNSINLIFSGKLPIPVFSFYSQFHFWHLFINCKGKT